MDPADFRCHSHVKGKLNMIVLIMMKSAVKGHISERMPLSVEEKAGHQLELYKHSEELFILNVLTQNVTLGLSVECSFCGSCLNHSNSSCSYDR